MKGYLDHGHTGNAGANGNSMMKTAKDGWILVTERPEARLRFAAQPKIYFDDGTSQLLHVHGGETKQEAELKANEELQKFLTQHA